MKKSKDESSNVDFTTFGERKIHREGHSFEQLLQIALKDYYDFMEQERGDNASGFKVKRMAITILYEKKHEDGITEDKIHYYLAPNHSVADFMGLLERAKFDLFNESVEFTEVDD